MSENVTIGEQSVLSKYIRRSRNLPYTNGGAVCTRVGDGCIRISNCSCDGESDPSGC